MRKELEMIRIKTKERFTMKESYFCRPICKELERDWFNILNRMFLFNVGENSD